MQKKEEPATSDRKETVSNADLTIKRQEKTEFFVFIWLWGMDNWISLTSRDAVNMLPSTVFFKRYWL